MRTNWRVRGLGPRRLTTLAMLLALTLAAGACGGRNGSQPASLLDASETLTELSSPGAMLPEGPPRSTAYVEADLAKDGADFDPLLPVNLAAIDGTGCLFTPNFGPGQPLAQAAYAVYRFSISGYDRNPQVRHTWDTAPDGGAVYFGLSAWDSDRWQWFEVDPAEPCELGEIEPFIRDSTSELLVAVMCIGTQASKLDSLRIGSQPPTLLVGVSGLSGFVPLSTSFNASASSDPDGEIVGFEWDLDGDGTFEIDSGLTAVQSIENTTAGATDVSVRATDNDGVTTTRTYTIRAFAEWQHSWGGSSAEGGAGVAYDGADYIYVAGTTLSFGAGSADIVLLKFDLAGELTWQHTWGTSNVEGAAGLDIGADGGIYVLGNSSSAPFVVKFNSRGESLWARSFPGLGLTNYARGLWVHGDDVYFCGETLDQVSLDNHPFVIRMDADGGTVWARRATSDGYLNALTVQNSLFLSTAVVAVGQKSGGAYVLRLDDESGDLLSARTWHSPAGSAVAWSVTATGVFNPQVWIGGVESSSGTYRALLLEYGADPVARVWDAGSTPDDYEMSYGVALLNGQVILGGLTTSFGAPQDGMLLRFGTDGVFHSGTRLSRSGLSCSFENDLKALAGTALASVGWCNATAGATWLSTSGMVNSRTASWEDVSVTLDTLTVTGQELTGSRGTPGSAVLDSGGGSTDLLVSVRQAP